MSTARQSSWDHIRWSDGAVAQMNALVSAFRLGFDAVEDPTPRLVPVLYTSEEWDARYGEDAPRQQAQRVITAMGRDERQHDD